VTATERYELFYWPTIQGRGEFVRLAFEDAGADYVDVARLPESEGGGVTALLKLLRDASLTTPALAPPFVRAGDLVVAQTANILQFVGPRVGLAPGGERGRLWAHQLQLTVSDLVGEAHDTHHPIDTGRYYEDQKPEAKRRAEGFITARLPKFLGYFSRALERNGGEFFVGRRGVVRRPLGVPGDGRARVRVSPRDEGHRGRLTPAHRAARPRRRAPAPRGVPRVAAKNSLQRAGDLSPLPRANPASLRPGQGHCAQRRTS